MKRLLVCLLALTWGAKIAAADGGLDATDPNASNRGQFGLSAKFVTGYRAIFPYGDGFYCGDNSDPTRCLGRSPLSVNLGLSYRALDKLDVLMEMRLGLERDFGVDPSSQGPRIRMYAPGIRAYVRDSGGLKAFIGLQFVIDTTTYPQHDKTDYGMRGQMGLMLDPHRTVGIMLFFGPSVSWSRWLKFEIEGGLGIQARFP